MEIMATSKNYGKKKGSDHFRDILNPYGEKSNYGKIGRRRRLSKLNVLFFSIILSVTIYIYILFFLFSQSKDYCILPIQFPSFGMGNAMPGADDPVKARLNHHGHPDGCTV